MTEGGTESLREWLVCGEGGRSVAAHTQTSSAPRTHTHKILSRSPSPYLFYPRSVSLSLCLAVSVCLCLSLSLSLCLCLPPFLTPSPSCLHSLPLHPSLYILPTLHLSHSILLARWLTRSPPPPTSSPIPPPHRPPPPALSLPSPIGLSPSPSRPRPVSSTGRRWPSLPLIARCNPLS